MNIKKLLSTKLVDGKKQILVRVDVSRSNRPSLKTGVFVHPELFDEENGVIRIPKNCRRNASLVQEAEEVNCALHAFCLRVTTLCQQASDEGIEVTRDWLMCQMEGEKRTITSESITSSTKRIVPVSIEEINHIEEDAPSYESHDFYKLIIQYSDVKQLSESRARTYKTLARQLRRFELYQQAIVNPRFSLNYDVLTTDDLIAFRNFIYNEVELVKKYPTLFKRIVKEAPYGSNEKRPKKVVARGSNYVTCVLKRLAAIFHWLHYAKKTTNKPFDGFVYDKEIYGNPIYLTKEERNRIATTDLSQADIILQQQRDIFVFQCHVGCRVGDLLTLMPLNVSNEGILEYIPKKTRHMSAPTKVRVPLDNTALSLIEKYKNVDLKGRLFPFLSAQKYNERIKKVLEKCEVNRIVQVRNPKTGNYEPKPIYEVAASHMGRKTFIGVTYKLTHDPNIIGKMTGHVEGSKAFCRYRSIDDEDLRDLINRMDA